MIDKDTTVKVWHDIEIKQPDHLKGKKGKVYCIIAIKEFQQDIEDFLIRGGYAEAEDYLFLFHKPTVIKSQQPYVDIYGNEWEGDAGTRVPVTAYNCKIHIDSDVSFDCGFFVCNSTIVINEKVSFGKGTIFGNKGGKIEIGAESRFGDNFLLECYSGGSISIGAQVNFGLNAWVACYEESSLTVGDKCSFMANSLLASRSKSILKMGKKCAVNRFFYCVTFFDGVVEIGDGFLASIFVSVFNNDSHPIFDVATEEQINRRRTITIADHVWVGLKATILSGADVGAACVIGANAVVTKRFPNNCTLGGVPAKVLHKNVTWEVDLEREIDQRYLNFTEEILDVTDKEGSVD